MPRIPTQAFQRRAESSEKRVEGAVKERKVPLPARTSKQSLTLIET